MIRVIRVRNATMAIPIAIPSMMSRRDRRVTYPTMSRAVGFEALDSREIEQTIVRHQQMGNDEGVPGTPTFFLNGLLVRPLPMTYEEFDARIRELLVP